MRRILCVLAIMLCGVLVIGCASKKQAETNFNNHLIEIRNNLFVGQDETYYATVCTGQREQNYALDGVIDKLVPFGIGSPCGTTR